jgi:hypothetical protein
MMQLKDRWLLHQLIQEKQHASGVSREFNRNKEEPILPILRVDKLNTQNVLEK